MDPGAPFAFAAGVLAFSSPCCLPLLPGYLVFVADLSSDAEELLTYAGSTASLAQGPGLLFIYSLGLGLPFVGVALLYRRVCGRWAGCGATAAPSAAPVAWC